MHKIKRKQILEKIAQHLFDKGMSLKDISDIGNLDNPDFWIRRVGSEESIGRLSMTTPDSLDSWFGIRIKKEYRESIEPKYIYYYLDYLRASGFWSPFYHGTTRLLNIRKRDIENIPL